MPVRSTRGISVSAERAAVHSGATVVVVSLGSKNGPPIGFAVRPWPHAARRTSAAGAPVRQGKDDRIFLDLLRAAKTAGLYSPRNAVQATAVTQPLHKTVT